MSASEQRWQQVLGATDAVSHPQASSLFVSISLKTLVTVSALTDAKHEEAVAPIKF